MIRTVADWRAWLGPRPDGRLLVLFYLSFLCAAGFGQWLSLIPGISITLWPPNGVYIATLLLSERRTWPWWIGVAVLAELTGNVLWFHNTVPAALVYVGANGIESVFAAFVIQRFLPVPARLRRLDQVLAFTVFAVLIGPAIGATIGCGFDALIGKHVFLTAWPLWWIGDATGVLLAAPLTLVIAKIWAEPPHYTDAQWIEMGLIVLALVLVSLVTLSGRFPYAYLIMPPLLWAAVRFEFAGATFGAVLLAILVAIFTVLGLSEFSGAGAEQKRNSISMQLFLAVTALTGLVVAAVSRQHRAALEALRAVNEDLEARVAQRTSQVNLLMREVNHRSKNLLTLVQALARQTAAGGAADFQKRFENRLHSLAASQDLLVKSEWTSVPVEDLVRSQLAHLGRDVETRFKIDGPHLLVTAASAQTIGMALHELSTNAIKHGALSNGTGRIDVRWGTGRRDDGTPTFHMNWRETGGPAASTPQKRGFGTVVIGDMVCLGLGGTVVKDFHAEGFVWTVEAPQENVLQADAAGTDSRSIPVQSSPA